MFKNIKNVIYITLWLSPYYTLAAGTKEAEKNLIKAARQANMWERTLGNITGEIIKSLLVYTGIILLILISYAGVLWMTAGGNEEQVSKAKKIIKGSIVGFTVIIFAYTIVYGIVNFINKLK